MHIKEEEEEERQKPNMISKIDDHLKKLQLLTTVSFLW